jgi:hypothetical protein
MNSKKKGNRGELELVHILEKRFGEGKFKRTPSSGAYTGGKNRDGAQNLPWEAKITLVSDLITPANFRFVLEHKFYGDVSFWDLFLDKSKWNEWVEQVEGDAGFVNKEPLLVIKYNRHNRIALIRPKLILNNRSVREFFRWYPTPKNIDQQSQWSVIYFEDLIKLPDEFWFES